MSWKKEEKKTTFERKPFIKIFKQTLLWIESHQSLHYLSIPFSGMQPSWLKQRRLSSFRKCLRIMTWFRCTALIPSIHKVYLFCISSSSIFIWDICFSQFSHSGPWRINTSTWACSLQKHRHTSLLRTLPIRKQFFIFFDISSLSHEDNWWLKTWV